jgi:hypothetical protein
MRKRLLLFVFLFSFLLLAGCGGQSDPKIVAGYNGDVTNYITGNSMTLQLKSVVVDRRNNITGTLFLDTYGARPFEGDIGAKNAVFFAVLIPNYGLVTFRGILHTDNSMSGNATLPGHSTKQDPWTLHPVGS